MLVNAPTQTGLRLVSIMSLALLAGCASFAQGVTEAMLSSTGRTTEDTRTCEAEGMPFPGLEAQLAEQDKLPPITEGESDRPTLKVLYIHGIGTHLPGHGGQLAANIAQSTGLLERAPRQKRIELISPVPGMGSLGEINIARLTNTERSRDLLFYELTWSSITNPAKEAIAFDQSSYFTSKRASINQTIRNFINDVAPDPIAYAGVNNAAIMSSVIQTFCWASSRTWNELPESTSGVACDADMKGFGSRVGKDQVAFITHSLGSRITLDALQTIAANPKLASDPRIRAAFQPMRDQRIPIYMLSNQLPLLEAGHHVREVRGQIDQFCGPDAPHADQRFFEELRLITMTDPNDLMSYPVPDAWVNRYTESRLCPTVTNIYLNVVPVQSAFGLGEFANPLAAHVGYNGDERVGALIAKGAGHDNVAPVVADRCTFRRTDESLMR